MNRIPKAVYTKEFREKVVKLAMAEDVGSPCVMCCRNETTGDGHAYRRHGRVRERGLLGDSGFKDQETEFRYCALNR